MGAVCLFPHVGSTLIKQVGLKHVALSIFWGHAIAYRKVQQKSNHVVRSVGLRDLCFCQGACVIEKSFANMGMVYLNMKLHDLNVLHLHDGSKVKPRGPTSTAWSGGKRDRKPSLQICAWAWSVILHHRRVMPSGTAALVGLPGTHFINGEL